jgi:hypothetical protein
MNHPVPPQDCCDQPDPFARNQPLGVTTSAVREFFEGGAATCDAWVPPTWSTGTTVFFVLTSYALSRGQRPGKPSLRDARSLLCRCTVLRLLLPDPVPSAILRL